MRSFAVDAPKTVSVSQSRRSWRPFWHLALSSELITGRNATGLIATANVERSWFQLRPEARCWTCSSHSLEYCLVWFSPRPPHSHRAPMAAPTVALRGSWVHRPPHGTRWRYGITIMFDRSQAYAGSTQSRVHASPPPSPFMVRAWRATTPWQVGAGAVAGEATRFGVDSWTVASCLTKNRRTTLSR